MQSLANSSSAEDKSKDSSVTIESKALKGVLSAPPSKSVAHRAIICAALSRGECVIENVAASNDILATLDCMRNLGAKCRANTKKMTVTIGFKKTFKYKDKIELDCGESGSTLRFLMPLALLSGVPVRFTGQGRLMQRPQYFCRKGDTRRIRTRLHRTVRTLGGRYVRSARKRQLSVRDRTFIRLAAACGGQRDSDNLSARV